MIGLKRGKVRIIDHQPEWAQAAAECIAGLKTIFGDLAADIQHVGSTAIRGIKAKPILDIAAGVRRFDSLSPAIEALESAGWQKRLNRFSSDLLYVRETDGIRTHQLHILIFKCPQWYNYVDFRDYMNAFPEKAREYEALKEHLAAECNDIQTAYTDGKAGYMRRTLAEAHEYANNTDATP